ncbi:hypothetical protein WR25_21965 [Diploscapter pachys]|uniref:Uncharacterized protein n=1 Tax=Diploscapter pachys TaxID=2018661 RepID=A0A2A2KML2_9BILA|nr:hypothetical protein WR25_21965 [Diploscapter pachys]
MPLTFAGVTVSHKKESIRQRRDENNKVRAKCACAEGSYALFIWKPHAIEHLGDSRGKLKMKMVRLMSRAECKVVETFLREKLPNYGE